jgi:hypothetical protein
LASGGFSRLLALEIALTGRAHPEVRQDSAAFSQDASDNKAFASKGADHADFGAGCREFVRGATSCKREVGTNVEGGIIANFGHWIMEEQPDATVKAVRAFLDKK